MIPLVICKMLLSRLGDGEIDLDECLAEFAHWEALCTEVLGW